MTLAVIAWRLNFLQNSTYNLLNDSMLQSQEMLEERKAVEKRGSEIALSNYYTKDHGFYYSMGIKIISSWWTWQNICLKTFQRHDFKGWLKHLNKIGDGLKTSTLIPHFSRIRPSDFEYLEVEGDESKFTMHGLWFCIGRVRGRGRVN